jgi:FKBP-type peptidyl-prolyl cis-trans isomerase
MKHSLLSLLLGMFLLPMAEAGTIMGLDSLPLPEFIKQNYPGALSPEEGLHYQIEEQGTGDLPKAGDYLMVEFKGMLLNGTVFDQTEEEPFVFQVGYRQVIRGWDKGLQLIPVGSRVTLLLAPGMAYYKVGAGKLVPPDTPVMFDLKILKILNEQEYDDYMIELEEREREAYQQRVEEQFDEDKWAIHEYCMANKIKTKRTRGGVSYSITKKGKGDYPGKGDQVTIQYKGYLVDGTLFEKNTEKAPFSFTLGGGKVIKGLEEAIPLFNKGAEGWILIPSKLAYGPMPIEEEDISIPANSILVFKVKMLDIQAREGSN